MVLMGLEAAGFQMSQVTPQGINALALAIDLFVFMLSRKGP